MSATTYYTVTVDTEEEWDWASGYPTRSGSITNIQHLTRLQEVCDRRGAAVTYFVNHAVLAHSDSRRIIQELAQRPRVEIGMHIHPWNTPPLQSVDNVPIRDSFLQNLPVELIRAKLQTVVESFTQSGLSPRSYRGGRYSTSPIIQDFLRDHGILADCSILPFNTWPDDGAPDFRDRDVQPTRKEPRREGDAALWELPLTYAYSRRPFRFWHNLLTAFSTSPLSALRLVGMLDRFGIAHRAWLNFEHPLGEKMLSFLRGLRPLGMPFVCFSMHSSSLLPGGSPYSQTRADVERLLERADRALAEVEHWLEFHAATAGNVALHLESQHLESQHHASHRH
jgi:hypothetical protein